MNGFWIAFWSVLGVASVPAIRAAIKAYRAKKSIGNIVADAVEAGVDAVDDK